MQLCLASNSPRRRELIKKITNNFIVLVSSACELGNESMLSPRDTALYNAQVKAKSIYGKTGGIVLGADTIVVLGGSILGKPRDKGQAISTLKLLRGKTHEVISAVCAIGPLGEFCESESSYVAIEDLSDGYIEKYVESGLAMDKAGSYGIQDGYNLVKSFSGNLDNIIGLPVKLTEKLLRLAGWSE